MADIDIRINADSRAGQLAIEKFARANYKVAKSGAAAKRSIEGVEKSSERMGRKGAQASGSMAGQFANMARGALGVAAAVKVVTTGLQFMNEEAQRSAENIKRLEQSNRLLAQVSGGSSITRLKDRAKARDLSRQSGLSLAESERLLFSAKSEGLRSDVGFFARAAPVVDPTTAVTAVGGLQSAFGREKAGGSKKLINQLLYAAAQSNKSFGELAPSVKTAAQATKGIGSTAEETIAVSSVMAGAFKGEAGFERLKAFAGAIDKSSQAPATPLKRGQKRAAVPKLAGKGILGAVEGLMGMSEEERNRVLGGSQEAVEGFRVLRDQLPAIRERIAGTRAAGAKAGTAGSLFESTLASEIQLPEVRARLDYNRAKATNEILTQPEGVTRLQQDTAQLVRQNEAIEREEGGFKRGIRDKFAKTMQFFGGDEEAQDIGNVGKMLEDVVAVKAIGDNMSNQLNQIVAEVKEFGRRIAEFGMSVNTNAGTE